MNIAREASGFSSRISKEKPRFLPWFFFFVQNPHSMNEWGFCYAEIRSVGVCVGNGMTFSCSSTRQSVAAKFTPERKSEGVEGQVKRILL